MVDISSAISSASQLTASSSNAASNTSKTVAGNFDTFLSLLTTQLQNQDPSNPLDTNQFTQQLIQYTEVEQLLQSNKKLEALVNLASANTSMSLINYVGREVNFEGNTAALKDGSASWALDMPANSGNVTYVVKDAQGHEVFSQTGELEAGSRSFSWNGATSSGATAPEGNYSLTVTATDAGEKAINVGITVKGIVDGVDMTGDSPVLLMNGTRLDINKVREIHAVS